MKKVYRYVKIRGKPEPMWMVFSKEVETKKKPPRNGAARIGGQADEV